jgi:hypothetical protein
MAKITPDAPVLNMPPRDDGRTHLAWIHARSCVQEGCMLLCKGNVEGNFIVVWAGLVDSHVEDVDFDSVYLSFSDHAVVVSDGRAKVKLVNLR